MLNQGSAEVTLYIFFPIDRWRYGVVVNLGSAQI